MVIHDTFSDAYHIYGDSRTSNSFPCGVRCGAGGVRRVRSAETEHHEDAQLLGNSKRMLDMLMKRTPQVIGAAADAESVAPPVDPPLRVGYIG